MKKDRLQENVFAIKKVYGFGINDADYLIHYVEDGQQFHCPFYSRWHAMLRRCYSEKYHVKKPTYKNCTICNEWLIFSQFKQWMIQQDWEGKHLDKDLLVPGNNVYAPDRCLFVPQEINALLTDSAAKRGQWPIGVNYHTRTRKFAANISLNIGKQKHLGLFKTPEAAHQAYLKAKSDYIKLLIEKYRENNPVLSNALVQYI